MWSAIFAPNGVLDDASIGKLMFGTDMSAFRAEYTGSVQPYTAFYDRLFEAVGASEAQRERVNRGNALRLFQLDA